MKTTLRLSIAAFGLATFNVSAATLYVSLESTNPVSPFTNWATAATNIQHAVDAAQAGDTVLVTNGVYAVGGRTTTNEDGWVSGSRVFITNAVRLESINGPVVTTIDGGRPDLEIRCVYLGTNAVLSGFTLTSGFAGWPPGGGGVLSDSSGVVTNCTLTGNWGRGASGGTLYNCTLTGNSGGAYDCTLYNCTLTGNSLNWYGGGGASYSTLYNCTLTGNSAKGDGGGAYDCTLYNCTLTGNRGGGAWDCTLYNCTLTGNGLGAADSTLYNSIVYYNVGGNYAEGTVLNFSCTTPLPTNGVGNITGHPLFRDMAAGDFRLREDSPCIDAGTNLMGFPIMRFDTGDWNWVVVGQITDPTDMLGNTRFIDGNFDGRVAWDIGAYEFNSFKPPRFTSGPRLTANGWQLNIIGAPNKWVRLQRSSDLRNWEGVWFGFMGSEGVKQVNDEDTSQKAMFYRAVVE